MRQGPAIAAAAIKILKPTSIWCEPFCGGLGAAHRVAQLWPKGRFLLNDISQALITFWEAAFEGYEFPKSLSKRQYLAIKKVRDPEDPETMWAGSGWAFSSRYFGPYFCRVNSTPRREAAGINLGIKKKVDSFVGAQVQFQNLSFDKLFIPRSAVVYLDPPYDDSTKVHDFEGKFDYDYFWFWALKLSKTNLVCASGFEVPKGWHTIHNWGQTLNQYSTKSNNHAGTTKVVAERLFVPRGQRRDW